jgi:hypothetical protein
MGEGVTESKNKILILQLVQTLGNDPHEFRHCFDASPDPVHNTLKCKTLLEILAGSLVSSARSRSCSHFAYSNFR